LPRAISDNDMSMESGGPSRRGKTAAIGLVPNNARVPPQAGMAEGELPKARPTMPGRRPARCATPPRQSDGCWRRRQRRRHSSLPARAGVDGAEVRGKACRPPMPSSEPDRMLELAPFQGFIE